MSKKNPENKLKYHIKTKLQVVRLAVGLSRNSRWPKKNVNRKKKILATKAEVSGFRAKTFTCLGTEKC